MSKGDLIFFRKTVEPIVDETMGARGNGAGQKFSMFVARGKRTIRVYTYFWTTIDHSCTCFMRYYEALRRNSLLNTDMYFRLYAYILIILINKNHFERCTTTPS